MKNRRLREHLLKVQEELDRTKNVDERQRSLLEKTKKDIQDLLDKENQGTDLSTTSTSGLEETITHLEATHPELTLMLTDLLNILSNAGI